MLQKRLIPLICALLCLTAIPVRAAAAEVSSDSVYCFSPGDFGTEEGLAGICITGLPESSTGTLLLGTRVLCPGDILTADQLTQMTFSPLRTEENAAARLEYLPIFEERVAPCASMTLSIRGKEDKAPVAEDLALETYKNLELQGKLKVTDPEGQAMTYTITRQPRRGTVAIGEDGSFTYTPKKNKVGVDSFVFTATDPAGKVSREATVTITILKPTDAKQYTDTVGHSCRFEAEWMKHTGIFAGENVAGNLCFNPEKEVTRGEFVTMLVKALELPAEDAAAYSGEEVPSWLQPYLTAALRSGLTAGLPARETFEPDAVITGAEAAVMLQNALDLKVEALNEVSSLEEAAPSWAQPALQALEAEGICLSAEPLKRSQTAQTLYRTVQLRSQGLGVFEEG